MGSTRFIQEAIFRSRIFFPLRAIRHLWPCLRFEKSAVLKVTPLRPSFHVHAIIIHLIANSVQIA